MNQTKTPLYNALVEHIKKDPISFHVPGHKYGQVFPSSESGYFRSILKLDATELTGLDDLHSPDGPILEAERLLSNLYNVNQSFFLVNGSTVGNIVMVMSTCKEDDIIFVQRNCHKSVMNALRLAKAYPIFLEPEFDFTWNVAGGVHLNTVKEAYEIHPNVKAIILTYPNYYGMVNELEEIIAFSHEQGIAVLVDEAHGPHFILGDPFPKSAVQLGADIVVQSAHKTLPAMTMGSFLHVNSDQININKVEDHLHTFQSSSPSYPIMASLDMARSYLAAYQLSDIIYLKQQINEFRSALSEIPSIKILEFPNHGDPLKVTIQSTCGLSGYALQERLEQRGIFTELADPFNVLLVLPLLKENQPFPFREVVGCIRDLLKEFPKEKLNRNLFQIKSNKISGLSISYKEMDKLKQGELSLNESIGMVSAEAIIPYPPGVPLFLVGERITEHSVEYLKHLIDAGAKFHGGHALTEGKVKVFK